MGALKFMFKILIAFVAAFVVVSSLTRNEADTDKTGNARVAEHTQKNTLTRKAFPEWESREICERKIKRSAQYPSTVDIHHFLGYASTVHDNGRRTIVQEFTAKNGFGLELKFEAWCLIMPNGSVEISIAEAR